MSVVVPEDSPIPPPLCAGQRGFRRNSMFAGTSGKNDFIYFKTVDDLIRQTGSVFYSEVLLFKIMYGTLTLGILS
jgi:hypothetical protein